MEMEMEMGGEKVVDTMTRDLMATCSMCHRLVPMMHLHHTRPSHPHPGHRHPDSHRHRHHIRDIDFDDDEDEDDVLPPSYRDIFDV